MCHVLSRPLNDAVRARQVSVTTLGSRFDDHVNENKPTPLNS